MTIPSTPPWWRSVTARRVFGVELLYTDHEGDQRTITNFVLAPRGDDKWMCSAVRHWNLDRPDPTMNRPEGRPLVG